MEPFRPVVDRSVLTLLRKSPELFAADAPLSTDIKRHLIENLTTRYAIETGNGIFRQTLFETLSIVVASLVSVLDGTQKELVLPHALA